MAKRLPRGNKRATSGQGDASESETDRDGAPQDEREPTPRDERSRERRRDRPQRKRRARRRARDDDEGGEDRGSKRRRPAMPAALVSLRRKHPNPLAPFAEAFTRVLAILGALIVGLYGVIAAVVRVFIPPAQALGRRIAALVAALSRLITPTRGLLIAAIGCAILLALSQFADYRGIEIGADAYSPGIQTVAPAPEVQREELGTAHSYLMIPLAALAVGVLWVAVRTRRWQLCRLAVLFGLVAIVVAIAVDRPAGLDVGNLDENFNGVEAKLLGGYWMQIFAGAGLAVTSFLLGAELKREGRPEKTRRSTRSESPGGRSSDPDRDRERRRRERRERSGRSGEAGPANPEGAGA